MKKILLAILVLALMAAAWSYNDSITSLAVLPAILMILSILTSDNMAKAWGGTSPDIARTKMGKAVKVPVWSYVVSTAILPYLCVAVFSMIGFFPLATIIVFLTLPVAIGCSMAVLKLPEGATNLLSDISDRTINLSLMFTFLLTVSFIIGKFI